MTMPYELELTPLLQSEPPGPPALDAALPFLGAVKVSLEVRVGCAEATLGALLALRQGEVLALDRPLEQPLDVLIDGHVVARGTLVAVGEHFGLRLTETPSMVSTATDARTAATAALAGESGTGTPAEGTARLAAAEHGSPAQSAALPHAAAAASAGPGRTRQDGTAAKAATHAPGRA
jgi:flagellar motor switch protein FliN/FliY